MIRLFHGVWCEIVPFQNGEVQLSPLSKKAHDFFVVKLPLSTRVKDKSGTFKFCETCIENVGEGEISTTSMF